MSSTHSESTEERRNLHVARNPSWHVLFLIVMDVVTRRGLVELGRRESCHSLVHVVNCIIQSLVLSDPEHLQNGSTSFDQLLECISKFKGIHVCYIYVMFACNAHAYFGAGGIYKGAFDGIKGLCKDIILKHAYICTHTHTTSQLLGCGEPLLSLNALFWTCHPLKV